MFRRLQSCNNVENMRQLAKQRPPGPIFHDIDGFAKPDPRIYRETLRRGGCTPGEAVDVGNSLINDVQGAQGAGIYAVWLNRRGIPIDTTIQPDAVISNLRQLPDSIG